MQQAIIADLGERSPLGQQILRRAHKSAVPADRQVAPSTQDPNEACGEWSVVSSPNVSADINQLYAVAGVNARDIWAVGQYCATGCGTFDEIDRTLIEHWNGKAWVVVPSPNIGDGSNTLNSVAVISPTEAWAVGLVWNTTTNHWNTLALRWNGSQWSIAPTPNPGTANKYLNVVTATSTKDVWAFGGYRQGTQFRAWAIHWNGLTWTDAGVINPSETYNVFYGATEISPNDIWAVGTYCADAECASGTNLTEHWNGSTWSVVPNPVVSNNLQLTRVSGSTKNDVWAIGDNCTDPDCNGFDNYLEHWNGTAWSLATTPDPATNGAYWGVLGISPVNAYIVGSRANGDGTWSNLVFHWDGAAWSDISVPSEGAFDNDLRGAVAFGSNSVWVVGDFDSGSGERTQVLHYDGSCK